MDHNFPARRYAVISGKGGVGKSIVTANLAAAFSAGGLRTVVVDADLGLASQDVILGVTARHTLQDVIQGDRTLETVLLDTPGGFTLLPAGSGLPENTTLSSSDSEKLAELIAALGRRYDAVLFDAGAGIGDVVRFFTRQADDVLLVATPEPTSLVDAYATIKVLVQLQDRREFHLIVNQADPSAPERSAARVAEHLQQVITRFLPREDKPPITIRFAGAIPRDAAIPRSVNRQKLVTQMEPDAPSARSIANLAESLRTGSFHTLIPSCC
jgi:flagellar biosynthesis protein FlhG